MTGIKSKPRIEIEEGSYYLTLDQIREYYYPKHISVGEINLQSVGSTIMINNDIITILGEPVEKYKTPKK
jgi:hypothetical protein